jgi:hypothetical protein
MNTPDLGQIAEAISAAIALAALIESIVAHRSARSAHRELGGVKTQVNTITNQIQTIQLLQANSQRTQINVAVTTAPNAQAIAAPPNANPPGEAPETTAD